MDDITKRFNSIYNDIDKHLKLLCQIKTYIPFYQLIDAASSISRTIDDHSAILKEFGDLRNFLIHRYNHKWSLATPSGETVVELERILELLKRPPKLGQKFRIRVFTCESNTKLGTVSKIMFNEDYSQVPVYEANKFIGLLNTETISRWMTERFEKEDGILEEESVGKVLGSAVKVKKHDFLSESHTAYDALEIFEKGFESGTSTDAVLITLNGKSSEKPTGILTLFDIPKLQSLVTVKRK